MAAPLDLAQLEITRVPIPVLEGIMTNASTGAAYYAFSANGSLAYVPGEQRAGMKRSLVWVDRNGATEPVTTDQRAFCWPRLSPDGRHLAVTVEGLSDDIWVLHIGRGVFTRLTFGGRNVSPVWTPDSSRVTFSSLKPQPAGPELSWKLADGSGEEEQLLQKDGAQFAHSWSPDGKTLTFANIHDQTGANIWTLSLGDEPKAEPFLVTQFLETHSSFSPDGRWLAYQSNASGQSEIYVRATDGSGSQWQISTDGGRCPTWAGSELFYQIGHKMMSVSIQSEPEFVASKPAVLFEGNYDRGVIAFRNYDVSSDGQRFVMIQRGEEPAPTEIAVVLNWFAELERLVPTEN
jgi:Tol biopolymer transport system component